jgi:peroxiredoxin
MTQPQVIKKFWTPLRVVSSLIVLTLVALFGASSCNSTEDTSKTNSPAASPATKPRVNPGLTALPPNVLQAELRTADGSSIKLANYSGKVVFLNLWATWCGPCRREIPELVRLHKEFESRGVEVIGLSTEDPEASAEAVREFVRELHMDYHVGWAPPEVAGILMQGRGSIPQSFVISRDGRIVRRFIGFSPEATPPQLRQALEDALADKG